MKNALIMLLKGKLQKQKHQLINKSNNNKNNINVNIVCHTEQRFNQYTINNTSYNALVHNGETHIEMNTTSAMMELNMMRSHSQPYHIAPEHRMVYNYISLCTGY